MSINKKSWLSGLLVVVVAVLIFFHQHQPPAFVDEATVVEIAKVQQSNIPIEVHTIGTLVAANSVQIAPEAAGQVAKVLFKDGMFVKAGTPLIQLDDALYRTKRDATAADYQLSAAMLKRIAILAKQGIISRQDFEKAQADLQIKKAAADENAVFMQKMLLTAPFDGVVGKCQVSVGDYVAAGQVLVSFTDTKHLHVEYTIPEQYVAALKVGQNIAIASSAFPNKTFKGVVSYIAPTINPQDRTISLYADVANDDQALVAGLFVNVTQNLGREDNALLIPATSLMATIDGQQVYKVVNGKAQTVPVVIGEHIADNVVVLQGLALQDEVVSAGQQKIRDGAAVKV